MSSAVVTQLDAAVAERREARRRKQIFDRMAHATHSMGIAIQELSTLDHAGRAAALRELQHRLAALNLMADSLRRDAEEAAEAIT